MFDSDRMGRHAYAPKKGSLGVGGAMGPLFAHSYSVGSAQPNSLLLSFRVTSFSFQPTEQQEASELTFFLK